ncbi:MAG: hypothetical protein BroJett030_31470 [Alphaproteobacteria bacterium]|nr:MAG: hypothetical protein BroJett030_31470 [Alphaproteobacteria bacterium]
MTQPGTVARRTGADAEATTRLAAAGGVLAALAASSCCILPLALFSLGASGVWIGTLTALSPYQPFFIALSGVFLGAGYWRVYRKPAAACVRDGACRRPLPGRMVRAALWLATGLIALNIAWPYAAPLLLS